MDWDFVLETVVTIFLSIYLLLKGIVKALLPEWATSKKDVSKDIVLITGAGSGIGRLLALRFARLGSAVVLWDINEQGNEETAEEVRKAGGRAFSYVCDISKRDDVYTLAGKVKQDIGNVSILVNNAGIVTGKTFLQCPDALIEKSMQVNAMAHFWTVKAFLPAMLDANRGHVVSIASSAGLVGVNGLSDYCASKFAAVGFVESLNAELYVTNKSIYTTAVCPYAINTGMFDGIQTKFPTLLPILEPDYVADKIVNAVLTNQEVLYIPRFLYLILPLKSFLPARLLKLLAHYTGTSTAMDKFKGRTGTKSAA